MGAGYYYGRLLANRQCLSVWLLCQGLWDVNFQVDGLAPVRLMLLARDSSREVIMGSLHPFNPIGKTTCRMEIKSWQTSSWLILLQAVDSAPLWGRMPKCPSLGSGAWQVSSCNCTKAQGQLGPLETQAVRLPPASSMEWGLA